MARKILPLRKKKVKKGYHMMPDGRMMKDSEMKKIMSSKQRKGMY